MSCSIYKEPKWTTNVRYSKEEDGGEREERLVDICERADTLTTHHGECLTHDRACTGNSVGAAERRNPFKAAALTLAVLCLLLLGRITFLYISDILKNPSSDKQSRCQQEKNNQTKEESTGEWVGIQHYCYYKSVEMKTWTESRRDCESRGARLLVLQNKEEHDFVKSLRISGASWIGLQSVKIEPQKDWLDKWEWRWVDDSGLTYHSWQKDVSTIPTEETKAYMDLDGYWNHDNNGSKHWICEKRIC
ncbi:C-type lectin domain family 2 member B-like [Anabas testudineus]|uniref:C-type lectin domain family 2 member B-like n=1 Tax=Anabas testudineus TaxID=64144 RepID=UPI000E4625A2|nr:C-type lectin domain family 2 member B-like [Anabas testudineus]